MPPGSAAASNALQFLDELTQAYGELIVGALAEAGLPA
jgi:hypothetical protein